MLRGAIVLLLLTHTSRARTRRQPQPLLGHVGEIYNGKMCSASQAVNLILEELDAHLNKESFAVIKVLRWNNDPGSDPRCDTNQNIKCGFRRGGGVGGVIPSAVGFVISLRFLTAFFFSFSSVNPRQRDL